MEHFVIIVNGWKLLTIITKSSILDVAAVLDAPLGFYIDFSNIIIQDFLLKAIIIKSLIEKREKEKSYLVLLKSAIPITVVLLMLVTR